MHAPDENLYLNDDFAKELIALGNEQVKPGPFFYYNPDGDFIEFLAVQDSHDAERVSPLLTVYYSTNSGKLIGSKIKGVKRLLSRFPQLKVIVKDNKVRIDYLIVSEMWVSSKESPSLTCEYEKVYRPLMELINEFGPEVDVPELLAV